MPNMWNNAKSEEETRKIFNDFMNKYGKKYSIETENYIRKHFYKSIGTYWMLVELFQVYSELGIFPEENDMYIAYLNELKKAFGVNKNILDVASGNIPAFANKVALEQIRIGEGSITICDPSLIIEEPKYQNMKLCKDMFTMKTDISSYDLITGIMPCEATETIIRNACENNKDFFVAFCVCDHSDNYAYSIDNEYIPSFERNKELARQLVEKYNMGELVEGYLDSRYSVRTPYVYNKRR